MKLFSRWFMSPSARRVMRLGIGLVIAVSLLTNSVVPPVLAAPVEADQELLHILYPMDTGRALAVELKDVTRNPDNSVTATVSVRAERKIAYLLSFQESGTSADVFVETLSTPDTLLPLFPESTYLLTTVRFPAGSSFTIKADKLGNTPRENFFILGVDLAVVFIFLVGGKPPLNWWEAGEVALRAGTIMPWAIVAIPASLALVVNDIVEQVHWKTLAADLWNLLVESLAEGIKLDEFIAGMASFIANKPYTALQVSAVFSLITAIIEGGLNVVGLLTDLIFAPRSVEVTLTPAPIVTAKGDFPMLETNQPGEVWFDIHNIGAQAWPGDGSITLRAVGGLPLSTPTRWTLNQQVDPNQTLHISLPFSGSPIPGVYRLEWRVFDGEQPFGPHLITDVIVIPRNADALRQLIEPILAGAIEQGQAYIDAWREELERTVTRLILEEISRRLSEICGVAPTAGLLLFAVISRRGQARREPRPTRTHPVLWRVLIGGLVLFALVRPLFGFALYFAQWPLPHKQVGPVLALLAIVVLFWSAWQLVRFVRSLGWRGALVGLGLLYALAVGWRVLTTPPRPLLEAVWTSLVQIPLEAGQGGWQTIQSVLAAPGKFQATYTGQRLTIIIPDIPEGDIVTDGMVAEESAPSSSPTIGGEVEVKAGTNLNLRIGPGNDYEVMVQFESATRLTILDGPITADGEVWWLVRSGDIQGWGLGKRLTPISVSVAVSQ